MKITSIETIQLAQGIKVHAGPIGWLWVRIHTDEGIIGLGESYPHPAAERAVILDRLAPVLLGRNPLEIDRLWNDMFQAVAYSGWAGAEMRAISAVDIALWDIAGKAAGLPVYQMLGGASRDAIRIYNTCYDHVDFLTEPQKLAEQLLASGIRAMKIWPFDPIAAETKGQFITPELIRRGIDPLVKIREQFGDSIEVAMEFHGLWHLPPAIEIARALEPYRPMWLEEVLPHDNMAAYRELALSTRTPLCISERLMTRWGFRELIDNHAARIIMPDICWCGGISEAKKIATLAETHYLPIAPHNCGGPVLHFASAHLSANVTSLFIMETVRRHYDGEYNSLMTSMLKPIHGSLPLPPGPGLGVELDPSILQRPDVIIHRNPA